jgi:Bacterial SH3 domain
MSYIACPECGHRALSVATRCPHCGVAFPSRPLERPNTRPRLDWLRPSVVLTAVLVVAAISVVGSRRVAAPGTIPGPSPRPDDPGPVAATPRVSPDTNTTDRTVAPALEVGPSRSPPGSPGLPRYARTWVNVRERRDRGALSVRVLNPGEAVLVDSLQRGWYRVLADGRTLGYVHRVNLDAARPSAQP